MEESGGEITTMLVRWHHVKGGGACNGSGGATKMRTLDAGSDHR